MVAVAAMTEMRWDRDAAGVPRICLVRKCSVNSVEHANGLIRTPGVAWPPHCMPG